MPDLRPLVLLHSNDMHGDFLAKVRDEKLVGGVSMLSGYVAKVREEEPTVLYAIAGDMLQGSLIDTEYRGVSTMEIMNRIGPDVACVGNHEVDYGLPHLLFLEKFARFPILAANLYLKGESKRLLPASRLLEIDGLKVLFIGILTESVLDSLRQDRVISTLVDVKDAAAEVGRICNAYRTTDVDLTVLLTHIGFENDLALARLLDSAWGVDLIIGGHSHTILAEPARENGILVVQAGTGTEQVGRFDLVIDKDANRVESFRWSLVPIDPAHCPRDAALDAVLGAYESEVDEKYGRTVTHLSRRLTHPTRLEETELGDLFADACAEMLAVDVMLLGSGSIRKKELGPTVTLGDLLALFPYPETVHQVRLTGAQLRRAFATWMHPDRNTTSFEHYQVNRGVEAVYDDGARALVSLRVGGEPVRDDALYKVALPGFHFSGMDRFLGLGSDEVLANGEAKLVSTSQQDIVEEYLSTHHNLKATVEGRLRRILAPG